MSAYRDPPLSINEQQFLRTSLANGLRIDGRSPLDIRNIQVSFPGGSGTAQVQLGGTRVYAVTTADLVAPYPDRPNEGALNIFVNFSAMASPAYEPGHSSDRGVEQVRLVERGLRESRAIDLESLCVLAGEKVWAVRLDVHVLDADGNVQDALSLASVAALAHFRRPDVTVVGDTVTVHSVEDRQPVPLALHHLPISCTFAFFDPLLAAVTSNSGVGATAAASPSSSASTGAASSQSALMLVDPSLKEEQCSDSSLSIVLNVHGEICALQKSGGIGIALENILTASRIAQTKITDITNMLQTRLKTELLAITQAGNALRTGASKSVPEVFHIPSGSKPIDAFGSNVMKPSGEHVTAGIPIEVRIGAANPLKLKQEDNTDEDDDEEVSDDEDEDDEEMEDVSKAAAQEMTQTAQKLQAKQQQQQAPQQSKGKKK
jgi:exosome complex component RRP45